MSCKDEKRAMKAKKYSNLLVNLFEHLALLYLEHTWTFPFETPERQEKRLINMPKKAGIYYRAPCFSHLTAWLPGELLT